MKERHTQGKSANDTWYGWFFGGSAAAAASAAAPVTSQAVAVETEAVLDVTDARDTLFEPVEDTPTVLDPTGDGGVYTVLHLSFALSRGSVVWLGSSNDAPVPDPTSAGDWGPSPSPTGSASEALAEFEFVGLSCSFESRAGGARAGFSLAVDLEQVSLFDRRKTEPGARPLIGPKPANLLQASETTVGGGPFFQAAVRVFEPDSARDIDVLLRIRPLQVTLDPLWLARLALEARLVQQARGPSFESADGAAVLEAAAGRRPGPAGPGLGSGDSPWASLLAGHHSGRLEAGQVREPTLALAVDIQAPLIVISDAGQSGHPQTQHFVILDLGCLRAHNAGARLHHRPRGHSMKRSMRADSISSETFETPPTSPTAISPSTPRRDDSMVSAAAATGTPLGRAHAEEDNAQQTALEEAAEAVDQERFVVELSDMQMLSGCGDRWTRALRATRLTDTHVIGRFNVSCTVTRAITSLPGQAKLCLRGQLPALTLSLDERRLEALIACASDLANVGRVASREASGSQTRRASESLDGMAASVADAAATRAGTGVGSEWAGASALSLFHLWKGEGGDVSRVCL